MVSPIRSRLKQSVAAGAFALAALTLAQTFPGLRFVQASFALSQDVSIDNLSFTKDKVTVTIKSAVFQGTNLSKEEVTKLLTGAASNDEAKALLAKMSASKISIPEIVAKLEKGSATARAFTATEVNAGKVAAVNLGGVDVQATTDKGDPVAVKGGSLAMTDVDFGSLVAALTSGDFGKGIFRYSKFDWAGLDATFPDPETPKTVPGGNLVKVKIGQLYGTTSYDGDVFKQGDGVLKSSTVELPKGSKAAAVLSAFGYEKIEFGFTTQGDYSQSSKKLNVNDYTLTSAGAGALGLKAQMGNIDKSAFGGDEKSRAAAFLGGDISGFTLRYVNSGLFEKGLAFLAAQEKKKPEQLKQEWNGMVQGILPAMMGGDPAGKKLADAISAFIANPKSLTISAKAKAASIPFKDFAAMKSPLELLPKVELTAVANQ